MKVHRNGTLKSSVNVWTEMRVERPFGMALMSRLIESGSRSPMVVKIENSAEWDMIEAHWFYEDQEIGAGDYFLRMIRLEILELARTGGVHRKRHGLHFCPSRCFPHGFYYRVDDEIVKVFAVLDSRRSPSWIRQQLKGR